MNPFKFLREKSGLTQKKFCDEYRFAKQTLISIEQGVYEELSERMIASITFACHEHDVDMGMELAAEYGTFKLSEAYADWRRAERANCYERIIWWEPRPGTKQYSPMHFFVKESMGSVQGFAKQLKVQTAILLSYITGKQKEMPAPLRAALLDAHYPYLNELIDLQRDWVRKLV